MFGVVGSEVKAIWTGLDQIRFLGFLYTKDTSTG